MKVSFGQGENPKVNFKVIYLLGVVIVACWTERIEGYVLRFLFFIMQNRFI